MFLGGLLAHLSLKLLSREGVPWKPQWLPDVCGLRSPPGVKVAVLLGCSSHSSPFSLSTKVRRWRHFTTDKLPRPLVHLQQRLLKTLNSGPLARFLVLLWHGQTGLCSGSIHQCREWVMARGRHNGIWLAATTRGLDPPTTGALKLCTW